MKKAISFTIITVLLFLFNTQTKDVEASNHLTFQKMDIYGGQLLRDYSDEELNSEIDSLKNKFGGWRTKHLTDNVEVHFTSHTVFSYYNAGTTAIKYKFTSTVTNSKKISFDATGNVGFNVSGPIKGFKAGLDAALKLNFKEEESSSETEKIEIEFSCDPGTKVIMYVVGEGTLCNGVGKNYLFWIPVDKGGYEYFITQTMYQVIEKTEI